MGCCSSSEEDKSYQDEEANERTRLINPVSHPGPSASTFNTQTSQPPQKGDEQSALNRILQSTANNVIDVSAIDSHGMEQHEYMDKARVYNTRVTMVCTQLWKSQQPPWTPAGVPNPQLVLGAAPISLADIQLVTSAAEQANKIIKEIKVKHKEDLVVQFGVP